MTASRLPFFTALLAVPAAAVGGVTVTDAGAVTVAAADDAGGTAAKRAAVFALPGVDPERIVVSQAAANLGGNTSVRHEATPQWKESGYFRRSRDLGQTFTAPRDFTLDAILLRTGNDHLAYRPGSAGAGVFVQFFEVTGTPAVDDNGTPPGTAATHGFTDNHRADDRLIGVEYEPLHVARGGVLPDLPDGSKLRYLRWDLTGPDELRFEAGKRYAFMVGFEEAGEERNFTLANENRAADPGPAGLTAGADAYPGGWAIRREGRGGTPTTIPGPAPPTDPTRLAALRAESAFGTGPDRLALSPTTDGYPDVDTYRDLEFYLLAR